MLEKQFCRIQEKLTHARDNIMFISARPKQEQTCTFVRGYNDLAPFRDIDNAPTLVPGSKTGYLIRSRENTELRCERKTDKRSTGSQTSLSLSFRKLADSAEEAETMIRDRDCLSKNKKGKSTVPYRLF